MFRLGIVVGLLFLLAGCVTAPVSSEAMKQQQEADLVVDWQSWNSVWLIKPDITGMAGALPEHIKTFTSDGLVKLLHNLKTPRDFVVVVLDGRSGLVSATGSGGLDAIRQFFHKQGFQRVVLQDGRVPDRQGGPVILKDRASK